MPAVEYGGHAGPERVQVETHETQPLGGAGKPVEMGGQGERLAVDHLDRLEHTVADGQPVVRHGHRRRSGVGQQLTVDPDAHGSTVVGAPLRSGTGTTRRNGPGFGGRWGVG